MTAQTVKNLPIMQETWVQSLGQEDALEKGMATHWLENPMDRGGRWATVLKVSKSWKLLNDWHTHMVCLQCWIDSLISQMCINILFGIVCVLDKWWVLAAHLYLTIYNPIDCIPPGSSVHGIIQARILEWVAILFSSGPSQPRKSTQVSCIACRFFTIWDAREACILDKPYVEN